MSQRRTKDHFANGHSFTDLDNNVNLCKILERLPSGKIVDEIVKRRAAATTLVSARRISNSSVGCGRDGSRPRSRSRSRSNRTFSRSEKKQFRPQLVDCEVRAEAEVGETRKGSQFKEQRARGQFNSGHRQQRNRNTSPNRSATSKLMIGCVTNTKMYNKCTCIRSNVQLVGSDCVLAVELLNLIVHVLKVWMGEGEG